MSLKAGFAEVEITPPLGTRKIGLLIDIVSERVLDPLFARAAVIESGNDRVSFVQLDTLSVRWTTTMDIRRRVEREYGFPGASIMVAATHNHAGPAVANLGDVRRDEEYVETLVTKVVSMFGRALESLQEAEIGFGSCFEFDVSRNRRVVMRDGTTRTHGKFTDPQALCFEGPMDPEVALLAARSKDGQMLGAIVNFACHPAHHADEPVLSAGFPGVLAQEARRRGCPVTLFLNGASGNMYHADPATGASHTKEQVGRALANDVGKLLEEIEWQDEAELGCRSATVQLPFRRITDEEIKGTARGAQRFVDSGAYDRYMPELLERIRRMGTQPAEVQAIFLDRHAYVGIPAEYFVEHGLRIKEEAYPVHALVVGHANGMVGYVPHREAFRRGGYETTFGPTSRLAPEAGDILTDCAIALIAKEAEA